MQCPKCHRPLVEEADGPYICCADAPMQWQCLQCGKVSEGFAFPYGHCPECSGRLALRDAAPLPAADEAALGALRLAFEIELGGRAFYQQAAAECRDEELRALFQRFAVLEGEHMETLTRRYHIEPPARSPAFRVQLAAIFAEVDHRPEDPDNLFRIAIALEQRAAAFFRMRAATAQPGSAEQRLYIELAAEERDHANLLITEHERWRARKPGLLTGDPLVDAARAARPAAALQASQNAAALLLSVGQADRAALVCGEQQITYAALRERVACAAAVWRAHGLRPGDRVAIKLPDGIDWVVAFLGAIWAGGVAVAVNPQIPAGEWSYILDEAGFGAIVAEHAQDTPAPWNARVILLAAGRRAVAEATPVQPYLVDQDAPAFWCHSSGTTGKPKAVVHRHGFAREIERVARERLGLGAEDRLFATPRLFFSYPQSNSLFAGLKLGATVLLDPQWPTAESVARVVQRLRPTVLFSVPSLYRGLLQAGLAPALGAGGVRTCVSAGELLPPSMAQAWRQASGIPIVDGYGASEALVLLLAARAGDDGLQPSPGVQVQPLDAEAADAFLPTRLCFRVPTLALGYLDRPVAHAETFRGGAFCPADLFVRTPGGGWRFAGREDSLLKIKGRWVNLSDVEEQLGPGVPALLESACVCVPDPEGVDALVMFYVAQPGEADQVERALRERAERLPPYQRPRWFRPVPTLPRSPTGKLLRRRLAEAFLGGTVIA